MRPPAGIDGECIDGECAVLCDTAHMRQPIQSMIPPGYFVVPNNNYAVSYQASMRPHIDKTADRTHREPKLSTARRRAEGESRRERSDADANTIGGDLGPLTGMIGYALRRAQLAVFDDAIRSFAELDLRPAQFSVLALIGHRPGLKQSEVAAALGIQRANFVTLLDELERRGLARRDPAPNDRRRHALHLTAEGERLLTRASRIEAGIEARLDAKLGPGGRERLLNMLWRLARD
jgi:DNA-binding MarR family transcriptional regulator